MVKRFLAGLLAAFLAVGHAGAVDANQATRAELESVTGIGPALCETILDERRKGAFEDWQDLIGRVKGIGEKSAARFSAAGLTVNGVAYHGAAPTTKKDYTTRPPAAKPAAEKASGLALK